MAVRAVAFLCLGLLAGGCVQSTLEVASDASLTPRDKKLLANAPYAQATIPEPYKRHIVTYHRKETPGSIVVDSDARYLYYVLPDGQGDPLRHHRRRGRAAFSGVARVGRKEEWPSWTPTNDIKKRLGDIPAYVAPGPHNPMGSRALYVYSGNKDTLYRIHGTNQPEYIGSAISSGCIRLTNEDVDRSVQPREDQHGGGRAGAGAGRLAEQSAGGFRGRTRRLAQHSSPAGGDLPVIIEEHGAGVRRTPGASPAFCFRPV